MWSWGNNGNGQLGLGDTITRSSPVQVGALTDWAQIGGKNFFCLAVRTNGTLWAWGINTFGAGIAGGQLGQNDVINRSSPVQVGALTSWKNVAPGALNESAIALETA
jgi:alpha-tubulin suppressor-like RCC1 family protein